MRIERLTPTKTRKWGWKIDSFHNGAPFTRQFFDIPKRQSVAEFKLALKEERLAHDRDHR
jgi:hypothetical protein